MRRTHCSLFALLAGIALSVASPAPLRAQTPQCGGANLLTKMQAEDPRAYDEIVAEARNIPNGKDMLWKVEREGLPPSYLYGTVHSADPRIVKIPNAVSEALEVSDVLVLETTEILDLAKARILAFTEPDVMMMPAGKRIEDFLTPEQKTMVNDALTARGAPLSAVNTLRPSLVASIFAITCKKPAATQNVPVLDQQLAINAMTSNIPVKGLETLIEQYAAFNSMSLEAQVQALLNSIKSAQQLADADETTIALYATGDLSLLQPLLRRMSKEQDDQLADLYSEFEGEVIIRRNHLMAERAQPFLNEGGAFIAVGALHLQGQEGLVELFRSQGFELTPAR